MYNWSTDIKELKKNREAYKIWRIEQKINFGLNGAKLNARTLKKYWSKLTLDPARKKFLRFILHAKNQHS